jgi:hypothetical protein
MNNADGRNQYSNVIALKNMFNNQVAIISNPVLDKVIRIQFNNVPAGKYEMGLLSVNGQLIQKQNINYTGLSTTNNMNLVSSLSSGVYVIRITGNNLIQDTKIIIE